MGGTGIPGNPVTLYKMHRTCRVREVLNVRDKWHQGEAQGHCKCRLNSANRKLRRGRGRVYRMRVCDAKDKWAHRPPT
ncbi:hypothetical protein N658DRAFT_491928 [Parathielavia hyrcaniae]|uniref:Uncharacterized protein n=1 Tax=Parathielavia hyrcaniae TaxID=113614 RepID=A0AAN6Q892_9PEZI|nr:hypothetical protein N658DRAFT_491928 [Parathielavia hyrcaniae]